MKALAAMRLLLQSKLAALTERRFMYAYQTPALCEAEEWCRHRREPYRALIERLS
jgi:hypothetical protein